MDNKIEETKTTAKEKLKNWWDEYAGIAIGITATTAAALLYSGIYFYSKGVVAGMKNSDQMAEAAYNLGVDTALKTVAGLVERSK